MLTTEPTQEMITEWKRIFEAHHTVMSPNRKLGVEVDFYKLFGNAEFRDMISAEIMGNDFKREKLPKGTCPDVKCYTVGNVLIGIDLNSGEFHIEGIILNSA